MSQITTCPACATAFRVVPDQLRLADGWVRCGECAEVFDARLSLESWDDDAEPADAGHPQAMPATQPGAVPFGDPDVPQDFNGPDDPDDPDYPDDLARQLDEARYRPPDLLLDELAFPQDPVSHDPWAEPATGAPPLPGSSVAARHEDDAPALPGTAPSAPSVASALPADTDAEDLSFMRAGRGAADGRPRTAVRVALVLAALVLLALLAAQFVLHHRDRLAGLHPPLAPALRSACALLGCEVGLPRAIESIVIDSSTFARLRPDAFRLGVTLRNQAVLPVEVPALELTLTDAEDRAVARRVLRPQDLGAAPGTIAPGGDWATSATVVVDANGLAARVAGYRLLAFYP